MGVGLGPSFVPLDVHSPQFPRQDCHRARSWYRPPWLDSSSARRHPSSTHRRLTAPPWTLKQRTQVWGATEMRPYTGECLDELRAQGFQVVEVETSQLSDDEDGNTTFAIFQIKPPVAQNSESPTIPQF
ncbi:Membrane trafficking VPS53 family protein isoform 1 [Hibiscus syriacus]|uniref:Membrane trafficking VPS53 family protein isoform 1 n=1 Tax=Hibiscus syriacus TaxID=106335 RepID=A0A6A3BZ08_HIBSY|nr:Membrane trafficking VPS53 family protein isoform 1 [Hibiscus syriacus]